jgi:hypothetical protein
VPITFEVGDNLAFWRAEIPGQVLGRADALTGPTTSMGKRVQAINPPGSEVGPGQVATWGRSSEKRAEGSASAGWAKAGPASTSRSSGRSTGVTEGSGHSRAALERSNILDTDRPYSSGSRRGRSSARQSEIGTRSSSNAIPPIERASLAGSPRPP